MNMDRSLSLNINAIDTDPVGDPTAAVSVQTNRRLTPLRAIRRMCLHCVETVYEVRHCQGDTSIDGPCPLFERRSGHRPPQALHTPVKAIRAKCVSCMGGHYTEVRECPSETTCPLWAYRLGTNPALVGKRATGAGLAAITATRDTAGVR